MELAPFALVVLVLALGSFVWWLIMLIEALRIPSPAWQAADQNQVLYVLLMVFLGVIGTILYMAVARPRLVR